MEKNVWTALPGPLFFTTAATAPLHTYYMYGDFLTTVIVLSLPCFILSLVEHNSVIRHAGIDRKI